MAKLELAVIFGGVSSEHEVSLMSATSIIENLSKEKYNIHMVGITKDGRWLLYRGDPSALADGVGRKTNKMYPLSYPPTVPSTGFWFCTKTAPKCSGLTQSSQLCTAKMAKTAPYKGCSSFLVFPM